MLPNSASEKLESLKLAVEAQLGALVYAGSCKEKIVYQLEKLREHFEAARATKQQALRRQMRKACNFLAPNGRVQDMELAGIQIPLRYSRAGLRSLYGKLDILKFEHQLISMD